MTEKKYRVGFYGGKFLPFHKGHKYCIEYAAKECDELYVILFYNDITEQDIISNPIECPLEWLNVEERERAIVSECMKYENVRFIKFDCQGMYDQSDNSEKSYDDWDYQTEYVIKEVGEFDCVYSSEPSYGNYFSRAYPWAEHIVIDAPRIHVPISGSMIRNMEQKSAAEWI